MERSWRQWTMFTVPRIYDDGSLLTPLGCLIASHLGVNHHTVESPLLLNDWLFSSKEVLIALNCMHRHYARGGWSGEWEDEDG